MSTTKVLAWTALAWLTTGSLAHADPFSWTGGPWRWSHWGENWQNSASSSFDPRSVPDPSQNPTSSGYTPTTTIAPTVGSPISAAPTVDPSSTATPIITPTATASAPAPTSSAPDAFINFGNGPYLESGALTTGTIQPWCDSAAVQKAFGAVPDAQQQTDFTQAVLKDVEATYHLSGLSQTFTLDPNAGAAHTLSVVSGAVGPSPNVIGLTDVGNNGFAFLDKLNSAATPDQLEWAVAHVVSHELMHAFGVAVHEDQTGNFLDAATVNWSLLTNPNATLSPAAVRDVLADVGAPASAGGDALTLNPVPEPGAVAVWGLGALAAVSCWRGRGRKAA